MGVEVIFRCMECNWSGQNPTEISIQTADSENVKNFHCPKCDHWVGTQDFIL